MSQDNKKLESWLQLPKKEDTPKIAHYFVGSKSICGEIGEIPEGTTPNESQSIQCTSCVEKLKSQTQEDVEEKAPEPTGDTCDCETSSVTETAPATAKMKAENPEN